VNQIVLTTINAKWIHPSLALRLLKANLGELENSCEIIELNLRQPLSEKLELLLTARPRILGISVSIWNHLATLELLSELEKSWTTLQHDQHVNGSGNLLTQRRSEPTVRGAKDAEDFFRPIIILGGPEVSHLSPNAEIFRFADYVIRGEGEIAFKTLCDNILTPGLPLRPRFSEFTHNDLTSIKSAYYLYTNEDLANKLVYVEASRGCPFNCEFCLSAIKDAKHNMLYSNTVNEQQPHSLLPIPHSPVREFPLELFLAEMDALVSRGAKMFKFLDRTFNLNTSRAIRICEFFLEKLKTHNDLVAHFEMVPSLFSSELVEALSRFPPGTLRLEIGIQTLNAGVSARIGRPSNPEKELETIRLLCNTTNAIIHADLIAGLPGENLASFGEGFDRLWCALGSTALDGAAFCETDETQRAEIQLGILKLLPGAPISRHNEAFAMRYNPLPPYEVVETAAMSAGDLRRVKNFARFWELLVNRGLVKLPTNENGFEKFMSVSDFLFDRFKRNWGIDKNELLEALKSGHYLD